MGFLVQIPTSRSDTYTSFRVGRFGERKGVGERGHWLREKRGDQKNESHAESGAFQGVDGLPVG